MLLSVTHSEVEGLSLRSVENRQSVNVEALDDTSDDVLEENVVPVVADHLVRAKPWRLELVGRVQVVDEDEIPLLPLVARQ